MSDTQQNSPETASAPQAPTLAAAPESRVQASDKTSPGSQWLPIAAGLLGLAGLGLGWQSMSRQQALEQELVRRQELIQTNSGEAKAAAKASQELTRDTAAKVALLDARLAEVALQRGQLEELIQSMSRSRDENVIGDIEASIRVALQQSAITGSAEPLVVTLKLADERLLRYKQPRMEGVRRAVARDLDRVKSVSVVDVSTLTIKLDEVVRLLDELPLTVNAEKAAEPKAAAEEPRLRPGSGRPLKASAAAEEKPPTAADGELAQWWWTAKKGLRETAALAWTETRSLIRVTRIEHPEAALLAPEQAFFLRENIKLRLLNARLALLSRQFETAQADLRDSQEMLNRYFDGRSRKVQVAGDLLRQVAGQARQVIVPRPDDTLAALSAAAAGR
ncbi:uroporphyrin-3 C-methyltransferase [Paucibacter oligotrophus]|uniref:Uroporphyrin-3 C-methyltransferase n=1 Tax=Roseateles oligotrophus TaxID=1769250 RepID=A0A840L6T2_9BURK|nr:uroporphyrin-3 C-methyltransferase [Roseateles oligotrophus]